ncbi:MAG: Gfo/Idh/MocA family oxidoreductase [Dysgonamonadaceae bacterium]|jgi:predicted dehydrogenase|nr:Gfo/Idh/MocA family oxidoreductase [Dysgonamonadaceae bacterium]
MRKENNVSRRTFLKNSALAGALGAVGVGSPVLLSSCSGNSGSKVKPLKEPGTYYIPDLPDIAPDGRELKAGIIGCGGRGSGAAFDFLNAGNGLTITALADTFKDRADALADKLKYEKGIDIPEDKRFIGFDAYKQLIDSDIDVVIIATPPFFRPEHFKYATEKGKHSFLEKPVFVDAVGYRTVMATAKQAAAKNLCVITGTQRHHQRNYVESYKKIMEGAIGEITGGAVYWNQNRLWYRNREAGWSEAEWMIRDWVNWKWLSGDHIIEQHVHNIDVFTWFSGLKPLSATGFGSRQRRVTGDQYDNFSVDFVMENGIHLHSMCRQINGCANNVSEFIQGTHGSWSTANGETVIKDLAGNIVWQYDKKTEATAHKQNNPYVLEHVNWIAHIRSNRPIDQASELAISNMAGLMGRESAYTGAETSWEQMTASPLDYKPADLNLGAMNISTFTVPVPGSND